MLFAAEFNDMTEVCPRNRGFLLRFLFAITVLVVGASSRVASAQALDKQKQLDAQAFWDNRDRDWFAEQIPFFECPDANITTT